MNRGRILNEWLDATPCTPFDWAGWNCCSFGASWVEHAEGMNPMSGLAGTPDAMAAARLVRSLGGMEAAWSKQLGRDTILPTMAQIGDVVMAPVDDGGEGAGCVIGICNGHVFFAVAVDGSRTAHPMSLAACAWRINPVENAS